MSSMTAAKLGRGWCRKTRERGEYVRKNASEAYTYISSYLVWSFVDHGDMWKSEGIDRQARRGRRPVYVKCTHSTRFFHLQQTRDFSRIRLPNAHTRLHISVDSIGQRCPLLQPIPLCSYQVSLRMIAQQSQSQTLPGN